MSEDEYTPQTVQVTIRTEAEWKALNDRMGNQWRDTPQQQLNAEVEKLLLQYAKPPKSQQAPGQPRAAGRRPRAVAA